VLNFIDVSSHPYSELAAQPLKVMRSLEKGGGLTFWSSQR